MMKLSNCCGHPPTEKSEEIGICPDCEENCEYIDYDPYNVMEEMRQLHKNYPDVDMLSPKYRAYYGQIKKI